MKTHSEHANLQDQDFFIKYQQTWESKSSVRSRPRRVVDFTQKGSFFPLSKQPLFIHDYVQNFPYDTKELLLLYSFLKYLNDIVNIEVKLVNSACFKIIYDNLVINYPDRLKLNAYTVITDEWYHVYNAKDIILQIESKFENLHKISITNSDAERAVYTIKQGLDTQYHDIFEIIAVCIFETTLVKELSEFLNNDDIHPSVRYYVTDHMNDEAKHHGFFLRVLNHTWEGLPKDYRCNIGKKIAEFIKLYLGIDSSKAYSIEVLNHILNDTQAALDIVNSIYDGFSITPELPIVKNILNVLRATGILKDEFVIDGFRQIRWAVE